ncbi:hypothetical protein H5410_032546 [Solanum commersonii]|uniref:Uncharacterized protein n=1 Tax=Solanum commersonii TaxID=4109 RepID=A0A9J5YN78_SOLCO|nr:hypothetical protein H5410_032546 [Solanum commersonii]
MKQPSGVKYPLTTLFVKRVLRLENMNECQRIIANGDHTRVPIYPPKHSPTAHKLITTNSMLQNSTQIQIQTTFHVEAQKLPSLNHSQYTLQSLQSKLLHSSQASYRTTTSHFQNLPTSPLPPKPQSKKQYSFLPSH